MNAGNDSVKSAFIGYCISLIIVTKYYKLGRNIKIQILTSNLFNINILIVENYNDLLTTRITFYMLCIFSSQT